MIKTDRLKSATSQQLFLTVIDIFVIVWNLQVTQIKLWWVYCLGNLTKMSTNG